MNKLIVGPSWVGDMVMAQSLFKTLKQLEPDTNIDVLAPTWSVGLLARMPEVRQAIELPISHGEMAFAQRRAIAQKLRKHDYQQAIVLPRSWKSALIPWLARIPLRTGYTGELRYGLLNDRRHLAKQQLDQTVKRFVALGLTPKAMRHEFECPQPRLDVNTEQAVALMQRFELSANTPAIGIMPGAEYGPAKQWPYYAELTRKLAWFGYQVWLFGSAKDKELATAITEEAGGGYNLCGKTSLPEAIDLIAQTQAVVSNDSGLMHIAAAVAKPVIALYGSSSPAYTPPLTDKAQILYQQLSCSPCFARTCRYGHYNCLTGIHVDTVLAQLQQNKPGQI